MDGKVLIDINNLSIGFPDFKTGEIKNVVNCISFQVKTGEILGMVGESGSGKSMTALSLMGLLPKNAKVDGELNFANQDLLQIDSESLRLLKGREMSMIFQEPMTSLNPSMTIGRQVEEMLILHRPHLEKAERKAQTIDALSKAGLKIESNIYGKYPHELSGGMRQRVMIAMAMICRPRLLIADEPTTALDVTTQAKILELIQELNKTYETTVIFISHDLAVVKKMCQRVIVMEEGNIVEEGNIKKIFKNPQQDYTKELLEAMPIINLEYKPTDNKANNNELSNKVSYEKADVLDEGFNKEGINSSKDVILQVKDLNVYYKGRKGIFGKQTKNHAVNNLSLYVKKGETLGIVGESGSGKSTLAKAIVGIIEDYTGQISLPNIKPQMVFQDPYSSLNPVKKVFWLLEEPLKLQTDLNKDQRKIKIKEILKEVGLDDKYADYYLSELSGGQRQRVAIGAALIVNPDFIVLDEPVSALDVTVQHQIIGLLKRLKKQHNLSYLFISHDINVVYQICDRVCVMYKGEIVETTEIDRLFITPQHKYTKELLKSIL